MTALREASARDDAQQMLKVGASVMTDVAANRDLPHTAAAPAHEVYTGVLYEALEAESLTLSQRRRAAQRVLIFSGLFGVTSFADPVPAYRLAMGVNLQPFGDTRDPGRLASFWRQALKAPLSTLVGDQLVVDCRSSSYISAFRAPAHQTLMVNNFTETAGRRKVVTHFAKHARGKLAGMLIRQEAMPTTVDEVAEVAAADWEVEVRPARGSTPHQLDLISSAE